MEINWHDDVEEKDQKKQQKLNFGAKKEDASMPKFKNKSEKERYNNRTMRGVGMKRELDL